MTVFMSPIGNLEQFSDSNGDPLAGGLLHTYLAGTTTDEPTYTDNTGAVANANPIVLDAAGYSASEIWFTAGITYKFVLTDSLGNAIGTIDNITGLNDSTLIIAQGEWIAGVTPTFIAATQFSLVGDQRPLFSVNRRMRATVSGTALYGSISVSSYAAGPNLTTVTVVLDAGVLTSGLTAVSYAFMTGTTGETSFGVARLIDGTVAAPGLSFNQEPGTGLFRVSAGVVGLAILGVVKQQFTATGVRHIDGTAGAPSVSFISEPTTGLFRQGTGALGVAVLGVEMLRMTRPTNLTDSVLQSFGTLQATSPTAAANLMDGGLGIAKALWVGGLVNVAGVATLASAVITGAATVGTTLGVTGLVTMAGAATVGTTLGVTGLVTMNGGYTVNAGTVNHITDGGEATHQITGYRDSAFGMFAYRLRGARGTVAVPADVQAGDVLGIIEANGYVNGAFDRNVARIDFLAETVAGSVVSGKVQIGTMNTGGTITTGYEMDDDQVSRFLGSVTIDDGKGILTDSGGTGERLATKIIAIGDWDMDLTATRNVAHELTYGNIRWVSAVVREDVASLLFNLEVAGGWFANNTNIVLDRNNGGTFDSTDYDATTYNRGWVKIIYAI